MGGDAQMRAVVNTYFSLCSCVMTTFAFSALVSPNKKFVMEHIQNATLAGGVAVGACADMMVTPGGAVGVGALAGILSVTGFNYVQPFLLNKMKVHDSCGVNNLHGMPGILGGLLSILMAGIASDAAYGENSSLVEIFPSMKDGEINAGTQALRQFLAVVVTLAFAIVGGIVTGLVMYQVDKLDKLETEHLYNDDRNIDEMEGKETVPEELKAFMEDMKNTKLITNPVGEERLSLLGNQ